MVWSLRPKASGINLAIEYNVCHARRKLELGEKFIELYDDSMLNKIDHFIEFLLKYHQTYFQNTK